MKVTATSHAQTGSYQSLKKAHLEHDEEKYNSNKDIRYDKKHLNTHHVHVKDFDAFYEEKYEGPIKEFNLKQTRKDRKIDDYDSYLEKKKNNKNRNQKRPHDPNRLFLMNFSNKDDNDRIKYGLMNQLNLSEDEYLELMAGAMDLSVEKFNKKFDGCMTVTEHFTHVNETSPHAHCNLYAHGKDKFGKPYTDINDSLKELYAGTKERDGKTVSKNVKDYWKDFRGEVDTMIIDSVKEKANEKLIEKGIKKHLPLELYRKDSDYVGMSGEVYKEVHREADKQLEEKGLSLQQREQALKDREQSLDECEGGLNGRQEELNKTLERLENRAKEFEEREKTIDSKINDFDDKVENFNAHVRRIYQDVDTQVENSKENSRVGAYIQKYDPDLYLDTLISANKEHADDLKRIERMKVQKTVKKPVKGQNEPQKDKEGFDMEK